ncbi:tetraacyldisaccharide 4'-kinase [Marinobacterium sediminicola]|uniref:Tetraacyldisaccharide 4'-kinase n=1 Tax=Marinobacterium sediminicola TaxID=518898 RepID=A0ABY1RXL6_9GAMM|nr:tetraacyldisaccharide 4'-kinase [Marinobacterium sediminicola]ULG67841.1 tetraacyldisaccharide 4'-kinase [Marinobacterium sediminicola]SMR71478.1 lipid-A-disaccharide kinase [Marinobacterium sediminicola]
MSLEKSWYSSATWLKGLRPISSLFRLLVLRRLGKQRRLGALKAGIPAPVIIVGNISVGGTGKTPLVIALIEMLREEGYRPGVISRGYGAKPPSYPALVTHETRPTEGGDEPCLIVQRTGVPLIIDPNRPRAAQRLLSSHDCNVIISDDGLQHYALARDLEIAVVDGVRGLGNGRCLPEGPLREPPERLSLVDWVVINGAEGCSGLPKLENPPVSMQLAPTMLTSLVSGSSISIEHWSQGRKVHAVAGIGNPARFFDTLRALGFEPIEHPLADHAEITPEMLDFDSPLPIIMTEKDAVKCRDFAKQGCWALRVDAQLNTQFRTQFLKRLAHVPAQQTGQRNGS